MSFKSALLFLVGLQCALAFHVSPLRTTPGSSFGLRVQRSNMKRSSSTRALKMTEEYWEGEWVCADCGYIYDKDKFGGKFFEEQKFGFKCPQCSAPRKRFAKKVGDKIGITRDGGDLPIVAFSVIGGLFVIGFGIYAALNF